MGERARLLVAVVAAACVALVGGCTTSGGSTAVDRPTLRPTPTATVAVSVTPSPSHLYDPAADPRADIAAALALAKKDGRRVLLDFGADWCPDCHVLATYFDRPALQAILDAHFHVVRIDVGILNRNLDLARQYGDALAVGIPSVAILDPQGNVLVSTKAGELADSRRYTADDVAKFLQDWAD